MKRLFIAAALALAAVAVTAAPAFAYGEPAGPARVATGGAADYTFENIPADVPTLDISVDGPGAVTLAALVSRTYTVTSGVVTIHITFPIKGDYVVTGTGTGPLSGTFSHSVTVTAIVPAPDSGGGLPATGVDVVPYLWFGSGAVGLGIAFVVMMVVIRRPRRGDVELTPSPVDSRTSAL
jgi:hypothetical protein